LTLNNKKEIYYLTGNNKKDLQQSPHLEQFNNSKEDVLLMTDPIDERIVQSLKEFKKAKLINAQHANLDTKDHDQRKKQKEEKFNAENKELITIIKSTIGNDSIDQVNFSHTLTQSPAIIKDKE